ncbi:pyruvate dehydrogenase (acetyl-transferring), homodimeric type [Raineyella sp. W15-4]|uniref:pyruvate dehydrogenase (acetyl-transferring), homodimeric type n=1 Tax=Raineyella sp. W15-4 TaxID=3081651 RepID=UPI002952E6C7|nr:pyruvate dehydrogenase (acetyl-transferring), homodimeric type [Raineyella sp. W15-4]WOQ15610.1 pyruvate dehydrogenase (acetyl-transferring), homodimeric type [Raineyella sp. W15-4]
MANRGDRPALSAQGLPNQLPDVDPDETEEWISSFDGLLEEKGPHRARYIMLELLARARQRQIGLPSLRSTDYINTISTADEPLFPGDEATEREIRRALRWNAAVMVSKANRKGLEVGGHIATYQSAASLYEVGFNHFFRGKDHPGGGDQIYFQGHASPGMYARAFLEGRLTEYDLDGFRQEVSRGPHNGLSSYPHPRLMPEFWEFPTVSMGIGPLNAIYQARFNRYLQNRGIRDTSQQHVWAFLGDGEMGEPESLGAIGRAAREELDNLTFVINCNLQQLDGPVDGNGKVVQDLESFFRGAGWNVIKVLWARDWDPLLAADHDGSLLHKMNSTPDGQFQTYSIADGSYIREKFFDTPVLKRMVEGYTDQQLQRLGRGGHDYRKVYAAYKAATEHVGQPTVILAQTVKGWTIDALEAKNATHQMKKLTSADLKAFRDRLHLPIPDSALEDAYHPPYFKPADDSPAMQYMRERRAALGGAVPERRVHPRALKLPGDEVYKELMAPGNPKAKVATTQAFVRLLRDLMRDPEIGRRIVPIAPDEFRTFGMDSMFPTAKLYDPHGQTYESVDRKLLLAWKSSAEGQLLHEGISEAGGLGSFTAAGSAYATHGEPMIPVFIFYSMFGFQRVGDFIWAASDQMARGFLVGATAGRTTLTGEGLQHADGHSPLLASTNPAVVHYDPAFGFEIALIVRDGLRRMYGHDDPEHPNGENVIYYLTMYNEPVQQPGPEADLDVEGVLRGLHLFRPAEDHGYARVRLLASGVSVPQAVAAQQILRDEWHVDADVWSVTSWNELNRDALTCAKWNLGHPAAERRIPYVTQKLSTTTGPVVAVSDYMRAVQEQIRPYVPGPFTSLGADGFGFADTRAAARRFFQIDDRSMVVAALEALESQGAYRAGAAAEAFARYRIDDPTAVANVAQEGAGA